MSDDGSLDARVNFTYDHFDGYRKHSASQRKTLRSNFGYVTDNFENRTWLNWTDLRFDVAGPVSEEVLNNNPTDVYPMVWLRDPHRNVEQFRVANRSDWQIGNQAIGAGYGTSVHMITLQRQHTTVLARATVKDCSSLII